jgi:hypothetical protein
LTHSRGEPDGLWVLSSEHRAAPALAPVNLELVTTNADTTHLEVVSELQGRLDEARDRQQAARP